MSCRPIACNAAILRHHHFAITLSMLAPRAPGAFVCLRCELRLARPPRRPLIHRPSHADFSASARHRDGADDLEQLSHAQHPALKIRREAEPLDRIRRRRGKVIRETSARLGGIKRLGRDAEILVLREVAEPRTDDSAVDAEGDEAQGKVNIPDILESIQQEGKNLTPDELYQQIESLRPKNYDSAEEPHHVSRTTFLKLTKVLYSGFTQQQLSSFYSLAKKFQKEKENKATIDALEGVKDGVAKRPVERTKWQPGTTTISRRLPGLDVAIRSKRSRASKQSWIDRILRDAWNLVLLEEIEALGELELLLKPWQLTLLNAGGAWNT